MGQQQNQTVAGTFRESLPDFLMGNHSTQWGITTGHGFGGGDNIGSDAPMINTKILSQTTKTGHNLIIYQQNIIAITDLTNTCEVIGWRYNRSRRTGNNRRGHQGGNRIRAVLFNGTLQIVRAGQPAARVGLFERALVAVGWLDTREVQ